MNEKTQAEQIEFLKSVIDKLMLCVTTNGGDAPMLRAEFDKYGVPQDYTYDEYVMDSFDDASVEDCAA